MRRMSGRSSGTADVIRVLYDGWPLVYQPAGPAAVHLIELIEALPEQVQPALALPGDLPAGRLPEAVEKIIEPAADEPGGRLRWEQAILPAIVKRTRARLLHLTTLSAPLFSPVPCVVSPAASLSSGSRPSERSRLSARLRESLARGGLSAARALLWPADLPSPGGSIPVFLVPPCTHSSFSIEQAGGPFDALSLPESYILVPGLPDDGGLLTLAKALRWIIAGAGEDWAVVTCDLPPAAAGRLAALIEAEDISAPLKSIQINTPEERAGVFQQAGVVLHVAPVLPWGDSLLQTLACARPLAALETPHSDARVGPAGYLAPVGDARALGAAALTLIVEEEVREQLVQAARQRALNWQSAQFSERLLDIYQQIVDN